MELSEKISKLSIELENLNYQEAVENFWEYLEENQTVLHEHCKSNFDTYNYQNNVEEYLKDICQDLSCEIGYNDKDGKRELTITALGKMENFHHVKYIISKAPALEGWNFNYLRQRKPFEGSGLIYDGVYIATKDMHFGYERSEDGTLILTFYHPYNNSSIPLVWLLYRAIGEYDTTKFVKYYLFEKIKEDTDKTKLLPFKDLIKVVDSLKMEYQTIKASILIKGEGRNNVYTTFHLEPFESEEGLIECLSEVLDEAELDTHIIYDIDSNYSSYFGNDFKVVERLDLREKIEGLQFTCNGKYYLIEVK